MCCLDQCICPKYRNGQKKYDRGIERASDRRCIILGDFNIKKGSKLDVGKWLVFTWENSREMLKKMREECLVDIWRYENPGKRKFY